MGIRERSAHWQQRERDEKKEVEAVDEVIPSA